MIYIVLINNIITMIEQTIQTLSAHSSIPEFNRTTTPLKEKRHDSIGVKNDFENIVVTEKNKEYHQSITECEDILPIFENIQKKIDFFLETNKIPHIIFHGSSGTGKRTIVYNFIHKNQYIKKCNILNILYRQNI